MTDPHFRVETELRSATDDLASELDGPLPPFTPTSRKSPAVLALVLLLGAAGVAYNVAARDNTAQVATTPDTTVAPDGSSTTVPNDGSVPPTTQVVRNADPVTGFDSQPADPSWQKPGVLEPYLDSAYTNPVRRLTDARAGEFHTVHAAHRAVENADGTLLLTWAGSIGGDRWLVVDRATGAEVGELQANDVAVIDRSDPHWHPTNPEVVRIIADQLVRGHLRVDEVNVRTGEVSMAADFTSELQAIWPSAFTMTTHNAWAGMSADRNRHVWEVLDEQGDSLGLAALDIDSGRVLGTTVVKDEATFDNFRGAAVSASGQFVITSYGAAVFVHNIDFTDERLVHPRERSMALALDGAGNDVLVLYNLETGTDDAGWLVSIDLQTLAATQLVDLADGGGGVGVHLSGLGHDRPGWVMVSTYGCGTETSWACDKLLLVELANDGQLVNVAHTNACGERGWQGVATVNRSMTRAYFGSDGRICDPDEGLVGSELYEVTLPVFG